MFKLLGVVCWCYIVLLVIVFYVFIVVGLSFVYIIGEFGVVLMIGGNIFGEICVVFIVLFDYVEVLDYM